MIVDIPLYKPSPSQPKVLIKSPNGSWCRKRDVVALFKSENRELFAHIEALERDLRQAKIQNQNLQRRLNDY